MHPAATITHRIVVIIMRRSRNCRWHDDHAHNAIQSFMTTRRARFSGSGRSQRASPPGHKQRPSSAERPSLDPHPSLQIFGQILLEAPPSASWVGNLKAILVATMGPHMQATPAQCSAKPNSRSSRSLEQQFPLCGLTFPETARLRPLTRGMMLFLTRTNFILSDKTRTARRSA